MDNKPSSEPKGTPGQTDSPVKNKTVEAKKKPPFGLRYLFPKPAPAKPARKGLVYQLEIVFGVAFVLATLFTAWTPGRPSTLFPQIAQQSIAQILQPSPTFVPGAPTATLANPKLIGIVAGHWKNDSGAVCADGLREVDLNLNIASQVQKILSGDGYQVELLQEFDPRLEGLQAAALVSIHNDSCDFINNEATGFKVAGAFVTYHPERTGRLVACLRARYGSITGLPIHSTSITRDMSSYHAFDEINENTPAAIIETGFMNLDRTFLTEHTDKVAEGVAAGILCYMRNEDLNPAGIPSAIQPTSTPAQ
jgi:N-acetylmuramoyl-L-alanine amidase